MTKAALKEKTIQGLTFFGKLALVIGSVAMLVVSAPLFIASWLINAVKSFFVTVIMWCIGKFGILILGTAVIEGLYSLKWITEKKGLDVLYWLQYNLMGHSEWFSSGSPSGAISFFSYPTIEFTIIIILTIIIATKMTVSPDDF